MIRAARRELYGFGERVLGEPPTMEHVLLVLFLVVGTYMYREAAAFSAEAATFPRLMGGATAVLAALLLARNYLRYLVVPGLVVVSAYALYTGTVAVFDDRTGWLRLLAGLTLLVGTLGYRERVTDAVESFVAEPMQVLGSTEESAEAAIDEHPDDEESADTAGAMYVYEIDDPRGPVVTGLLCVAYMVLTFTIGMLIATPVFVLGYALWARLWWPKTIGITVLSLLVAYVFYWLISDDIAIGWYTDWEPWTPPPPTELLESSMVLAPLFESGITLL